MNTSLEFDPQSLVLPRVPIRGSTQPYHVRRIFCVALNYADHAREMGREVSPAPPFYFTKSPFAITHTGSVVPYPPATANYQHEIELVAAIGKPAFRVSPAEGWDCVFGYACGLDMTRRDLQLAARDKGRPWEVGKDFEESAIVSEIVPASEIGHPQSGRIAVSVNGETKQDSDISMFIWNVAELVSDLSKYYRLGPGDLIYTGTPHGVGPVRAGDILHGVVEGVASIDLRIGPAA